MGPRGPPGPSGAPVSKNTSFIIIIILYSQLIEKHNIMLIIFSAEASIDETDMSNMLAVSTHQRKLLSSHCHLFPFQGPQGFQGNPGEAGEPGPAVSVPNLAYAHTHMTFYKPTYYMAHTDDTFRRT